MAHTNDQWVSEWARIRERGMWRFVVLRGNLAFGLMLAAGSYVVNTFILHKPWDPLALLVAVVIGGSFFDILLWCWGEEKHRKLVRNNA